MRDLFHDYLFSKGIFVGSGGEEAAAETLASLAKLFNIKIVSNPSHANPAMLRLASRKLGVDVPEPFYRGFPESVRQLSIDELFLDRLIHYFNTYGHDDFSVPGHSLFEQDFERACFNEDVDIRSFEIIDEEEAVAHLKGVVDMLLMESRPPSDEHYELIHAFIEDYAYKVEACNCKDVVVRLLIDIRDETYSTLLKLSDVIRLVEQMQFQIYGSEDVRKLNLRNRDRKLLTAVIDRIFQEGECDVETCLEKKKLWKGLLHHLHYKPVNEKAVSFLGSIRGNEARSAYSGFERALSEGDVRGAVDILLDEKGPTVVLRNLDYLLSRCKTEDDVDYVIARTNTRNKVVLIQMLMHYSTYRAGKPRVFTFPKFGMMRLHKETGEEVARRRSVIPASVISRLTMALRSRLEAACRGTLGRVYIDEDMKRIALPLQESASMGGVGTLTRGSRIPLPKGKKIRAFTYWELVDDIDLSAFGLRESGEQVEFSWRTLNYRQGPDGRLTDAIVFSGDQTSGYDGGSEYFDVNIAQFKIDYPGVRYIVFCDNVFSRLNFDECVCRAGYMMRDLLDSGEVFEPKTVKSSYQIKCASTFAYLFALDIVNGEFIWLNIARSGNQAVAGVSSMAFIMDYLHVTDVINLYEFASMLATEVVDDPREADVVFSDKSVPTREGAVLITSRNMERVAELLN